MSIGTPSTTLGLGRLFLLDALGSVLVKLLVLLFDLLLSLLGFSATAGPVDFTRTLAKIRTSTYSDRCCFSFLFLHACVMCKRWCVGRGEIARAEPRKITSGQPNPSCGIDMDFLFQPDTTHHRTPLSSNLLRQSNHYLRSTECERPKMQFSAFCVRQEGTTEKTR